MALPSGRRFVFGTNIMLSYCCTVIVMLWIGSLVVFCAASGALVVRWSRSGERVAMSHRHRFLGMLVMHRPCVVGATMSSAHSRSGGEVEP